MDGDCLWVSFWFGVPVGFFLLSSFFMMIAFIWRWNYPLFFDS